MCVTRERRAILQDVQAEQHFAKVGAWIKVSGAQTVFQEHAEDSGGRPARDKAHVTQLGVAESGVRCIRNAESLRPPQHGAESLRPTQHGYTSIIVV